MNESDTPAKVRSMEGLGSAETSDDEQGDQAEELYWRLHALSKALESSGRIDEHETRDAYPAILDAMLLCRKGRAAALKLAAFGAWCAKEFRDSLSDVDGGSAQDAMERFGVIVKNTVTESCGDGCVCVEYGEFPHACFTFPADVSEEISRLPNV